MSDKPTTCDGCGACCMAQGTPPNYLGLVGALEGLPAYTWLLSSNAYRDREDLRRIGTLPSEAIEELKAAVHGRQEYDPDGPCLWLDLESRQCRFYAHRPVTCSGDLVTIGNNACLKWRSEFGFGDGE